VTRLKALKKEYYEREQFPKWEILNDMARQKNKTLMNKNLEQKKLPAGRLRPSRTAEQARPTRESEAGAQGNHEPDDDTKRAALYPRKERHPQQTCATEKTRLIQQAEIY